MNIQPAAIKAFQFELAEEAAKILFYWATYGPDPRDNGFYGAVTDENQPVLDSVKGSVLNARILWSFANGYTCTKNRKYLQLAENAFLFYLHHFKDQQYGGAFWYVAAFGNQVENQKMTTDPDGSKKQVYAQAFWIYALSAYYKVTNKQEVLKEAIELFNLVEKYSYDPNAGGYFEAFARNWSNIDDQRLSAKDLNSVKTMNTHLHILEGYMSLFRLWPDGRLKQQICHLLDCFDQYIIDPQTHHLRLFFDADFVIQKEPATVSFGHDIEAAWLLLEAARAVGHPDYIIKMKYHCKHLASAALRGVDIKTGGLNYECRTGSAVQDTPIMVAEKHWWVQAEALVGFLEAYLQSGHPVFYQQAFTTWQYIRHHLLSPSGEWYWGIDPHGQKMTGYYKIGLWKCPYHNLRAMIEGQIRLSLILDQHCVTP